MKIGLLIAVREELEAFLKSGEAMTEETVAGKTIYLARMEGHDLCAVQSGCGEIDAAAATMLLIVRYSTSWEKAHPERITSTSVCSRMRSWDCSR